MSEEKLTLRLPFVSDKPDANGRVFSEEVLRRAVEECQPRIQEGKMLGMMEPGDLRLRDVTHRVTDMQMRDGEVVVTMQLLHTPKGSALMELLAVRRGCLQLEPNGYVKEENGVVSDLKLTSVGISMKSEEP